MPSDMWSKIFTRLPHAIDIVEEGGIINEILNHRLLYPELEERFAKGDAEHKGEWQDWERGKFIENIREEIYDMVLYIAMDMVRRDEARKYGRPGMSYNEAKLLSCEESKTEHGSAA